MLEICIRDSVNSQRTFCGMRERIGAAYSAAPRKKFLADFDAIAVLDVIVALDDSPRGGGILYVENKHFRQNTSRKRLFEVGFLVGLALITIDHKTSPGMNSVFGSEIDLDFVIHSNAAEIILGVKDVALRVLSFRTEPVDRRHIREYRHFFRLKRNEVVPDVNGIAAVGDLSRRSMFLGGHNFHPAGLDHVLAQSRKFNGVSQCASCMEDCKFVTRRNAVGLAFVQVDDVKKFLSDLVVIFGAHDPEANILDARDDVPAAVQIRIQRDRRHGLRSTGSPTCAAFTRAGASGLTLGGWTACYGLTGCFLRDFLLSDRAQRWNDDWIARINP